MPRTVTMAASLVMLGLAILGCSPRAQDVDSSSHDGGGDGIAAGGANPCGCSTGSWPGFPGGGLVISWECFCRDDNCNDTLADAAARCSLGASHRTDYPACGLTVVATGSMGGPYLEVFDSSGALVGEQQTSDVNGITCPTDPSFPNPAGAGALRAGRFPDAACVAVDCLTDDCSPCIADAGAASD